jgi:hypothetical protein
MIGWIFRQSLLASHDLTRRYNIWTYEPLSLILQSDEGGRGQDRRLFPLCTGSQCTAHASSCM